MLWKERLWILAHLPDLITTFLLAEVAHLQQNNLVSKEWHCGQWEIFFDLSSGPLITRTCMSIRGNTWTDALHAARFSCLTLSLYPLEVGWFLYPLGVVSLANSECICLRTCFTIILSYLIFYPILYSD